MPSANPMADPAAIVLCNRNLRMTVLTPKIVRVEYVPDVGDAFEDRATISFVNRKLPVPSFTLHNSSEWCNVSITEGMTVSLRKAAHSRIKPPTALGTTCDNAQKGKDAVCSGKCDRVEPVLHNQTEASCCAACDAHKDCGTWILNVAGAPHDDTTAPAKGTDCFLLKDHTVKATKDAYGPTGGPTKILGGYAGPTEGKYLRTVGALQASFGGSVGDAGNSSWNWRAWESEQDNLNGTLMPTPSADLAGCCSNPNATAGEYDPKAQYVLQVMHTLAHHRCTLFSLTPSVTPLR
jgi:hypothetical protein